MSRTVDELTTEIVSSLHAELVSTFNFKMRNDINYRVDFGSYVAEQYTLIRSGIQRAINSDYLNSEE